MREGKPQVERLNACGDPELVPLIKINTLAFMSIACGLCCLCTQRLTNFGQTTEHASFKVTVFEISLEIRRTSCINLDVKSGEPKDAARIDESIGVLEGVKSADLALRQALRVENATEQQLHAEGVSWVTTQLERSPFPSRNCKCWENGIAGFTDMSLRWPER